MKKKQNSIQIIKSIADSLGYKTKYLSTPNAPKRLMVSNSKKMCILNSSIFGFYPEIQRWQQHLFDSKILTQEVLDTLGYNTIPTKKVQYKKYQSFTALINSILPTIKKYPVIAKPETGFKGNDISIAENKTRLRTILKQNYQNKKNILIQPILHNDEYRILIVNNTVEVVHIKQWHHITGDGKQTLGTLLSKINDREKDAVFIKQQLNQRNLTLSSVLSKNDTFPYHLTRFSSPDDYYQSKKIPKVISSWAQKLAFDISSPTIGIDIFAPKGILNPSSFIIIELNANPAFDYIKYRYNDPEKMKQIITNVLTHYFA